MKVKDILNTQIIGEYQIEDHWRAGVTYQPDDYIESQKVEALMIRDNKLIISI